MEYANRVLDTLWRVITACAIVISAAFSYVFVNYESIETWRLIVASAGFFVFGAVGAVVGVIYVKTLKELK